MKRPLSLNIARLLTAMQFFLIASYLHTQIVTAFDAPNATYADPAAFDARREISEGLPLFVNGVPIAQKRLSRVPARLVRGIVPPLPFEPSETTGLQAGSFLPETLGMVSPLFEIAAGYSAGRYPDSVAVGDVNGDGRLDIIVADSCASDCSTGGVGVLLGNGDGSFQPAVIYKSGGYDGFSVALKDVNGDNKLDLVVANLCTSLVNGMCANNGTVGVLLGNGDGTFQTAVSYGSGGWYANSVAAADVNADGKPDLLVSNRCATSNDCLNGRVGVLLGNGDGTFQPAVTYLSGGYIAIAVATGDVNGDGKPDVIVANNCANDNCVRGAVGVLLGNGDGTFQAALTYDSGGPYANSVAVGDVNGDGRADLLIPNTCGTDYYCSEGGVGMLLGNGDGTFQTAVIIGSGGHLPVSVALADVNADGKPDLLIANHCVSTTNCGRTIELDGGVSVRLGNGDGTFRAALTYDSDGFGPLSIATGDVNGDGKRDIMVANVFAGRNNFTNGTVAVLLGNNDGTFEAAVSYEPGGWYPGSVAVGDVNGDGKADLLIADGCDIQNSPPCAGGGIGVLLGNGDGNFQPVTPYQSGGSFAVSVTAEDVNGDHRTDLIVANLCFNNANCDHGSVGVLLGTSGGFLPVVTYGSGGFRPGSVVLKDVNGDGKLDLIVTNLCSASNGNGYCATSGVVSVLLGNPGGTFQAAINYDSGGFYTNSVAVADVNGDSKPDLLVANLCAGVDSNGLNCLNGGGISVLLGNGDGTFRPALTYSSGGDGASSVATGDLNGDGKPDIVFANSYSSTVGVLLGNGDGTFQAVVTTPTPSLDTGMLLGTIALADFDGDGTLDIASGGYFLLPGNGNGTFQAPVQLLGGGFPAIAVGDFNRDGKPDIAIGAVAVLLSISAHSNATSTTLTSSVNPSRYGKIVRLTASVASTSGGTPTGSLTFYDGLTSLGEVPLINGLATLRVSNLSGGSHNLTGSYGGDTVFSSSTSAVLVQTVRRVSVVVTASSSVNPSYVNQPITLSASVSGGPMVPNGSVTFKKGTSILATVPLTNGQASFTTAFPKAGSFSWVGSYSGDQNFLPKNSEAVKQVVQKYSTSTALTSSPNPSAHGQAMTLTATVSSGAPGTPSGKVRFMDGTTMLGSATLSGGVATLTKSKLPVGTHLITAQYLGGGVSEKSASSVLNQVVQ